MQKHKNRTTFSEGYMTKQNISAQQYSRLTSEYRTQDVTKTRCLFISDIGMFKIGDRTLHIINGQLVSVFIVYIEKHHGTPQVR